MNRQQKETTVADLKQLLGTAQATFLVNYKGMDVHLLQGLRRKLRTDGGTLKVTKATLMRIAAKDIPGTETFAQSCKDQVGLVFAKSDISLIAKQLFIFAKEHQNLKVVAGFYESKLLSPQELAFLASLPSREVLIAQLLGTMQAPVTSFVRVLHLLIARLVYVLKQIEEKQPN